MSDPSYFLAEEAMTPLVAAYAAIGGLFAVLVWFIKQALQDRVEIGKALATNTAATQALAETQKAQNELLREHGRKLDQIQLMCRNGVKP